MTKTQTKTTTKKTAAKKKAPARRKLRVKEAPPKTGKEPVLTGEKQEANLATRDEKGRIRPGCSGNPKGRPKGRTSIPDTLRRIGAEPAPGQNGVTNLEAVMRLVFNEAMDGKPWAVQFIADRTEGKAVERTENLHATKSIDEMNIEELEILLGEDVDEITDTGEG